MPSDRGHLLVVKCPRCRRELPAVVAPIDWAAVSMDEVDRVTGNAVNGALLVHTAYECLAMPTAALVPR